MKKVMPPWSVKRINIEDSCFPSRLRTLADRPDVLFMAGQWEWTEQIPCVAVVGTRYASDWGRRTAFELSGQLVELGWGIISGLALGIDTAAHQGALDRHGRTGATLPGGTDHIYPSENIELAESMVQSGGFLLSEYAPDSKPKLENFAARDRFQSALALAVAIVETEIDGGTMHTAQFALEQGRPLFVFSQPKEGITNCGGNQVLATWPQCRLVPDIATLVVQLNRLRKTQT